MKRRILLVDDDVAVLLTLKAVLELHEFEVQTASSVDEAQAKLASGIYHIVITDARMESDTAGTDVIRAARKQPYRPATAILTAYPPSETDWLAHGADSLLIKPIGVNDLVRQIEALLVQQADKTMPWPAAHDALAKDRKGLNRERRRKVS